MIRVLVVDDHDVVRRGLLHLFASTDDIEVVGEAAGGAEAIAAAADLTPDVVLMDLSMPGIDGVEATARICAEHAVVRVVVLTSFSDQPRIFAAIEAGASGYLLKDAEPDELLRGVRAAAMGEAPFSPRAAKALLTIGSQRKTAAELTGREREVLVALTEGLANKQIARRLGISEKTVKAHLTSVFQRIGVADRTQAALWAQRNGLGGDAAPAGPS
jgi:DNA-binding NarL/FixJ family response regulator